MNKKTKTVKVTIEQATVLNWNSENNTTNGNPVYSFTITDESGKVYRGKTKADKLFVYGLGYGPSVLKNVTIGTTPSGRVYMYDADKQR